MEKEGVSRRCSSQTSPKMLRLVASLILLCNMCTGDGQDGETGDGSIPPHRTTRSVCFGGVCHDQDAAEPLMMPWQDEEGERCLRLLNPTSTPHVVEILDLDEIGGGDDEGDVGLTFRINCEGVAYATSMYLKDAEKGQQDLSFPIVPVGDDGGNAEACFRKRLDTGDGEILEMPIGVDFRDPDVDLVLKNLGRGLTKILCIVKRADGSEESFAVVIVLLPGKDSAGSLHLAFPPADERFVFKRGVEPFVMLSYVQHGPGLGGLGKNFSSFQARLTVQDSSGREISSAVYCNPGIVNLPGLLEGEKFKVTAQLEMLGNVRGDVLEAWFSVDRSRTYSQTAAHEPFQCAPAAVNGCSPGVRGECSGHGECNSQGWCVCHAGWFGDVCWHDVHSSSSYTPKQHPGRSAWTCVQVQDWEEGREELWEELMVLNSGRVEGGGGEGGCERGLAWSADLSSAFGTQVRSLGLAMSRAFAKRVPLAEFGRWSYLQFEGCQSGSLSCYFDSLLSCNASREGHNLEAYWPPATGCPNSLEKECGTGYDADGGPSIYGGGLQSGGGVHMDYFGRNTTDASRFGVYRMASPPRGYEDKGSFWWLSSLHSLLLRPNPRLEKLMRKAMRIARLSDEPYVGLHLRRGESCVHKGRCSDVREYFEAAVSLCGQYGINRVFVATDDANVLEELRLMGGGVEWLTTEERKDKRGSESGMEYLGVLWPQILRTRMGLLDRKRVAESSIIDLLLLSEAQALVFTASSSFSLLALELSAANAGFLIPYVGIGGPWWPLVS